MERKEAAVEIAKLIEQAQQIVYQAEALADEHGVSFSMNLGDYGMGGRYVPVPEGKDADATNDWGDREYGWMASSQSC